MFASGNSPEALGKQGQSDEEDPGHPPLGSFKSQGRRKGKLFLLRFNSQDLGQKYDLIFFESISECPGDFPSLKTEIYVVLARVERQRGLVRNHRRSGTLPHECRAHLQEASVRDIDL